jgi:IclR family acetate operon transcriptional repressor
MPVKPSQSAVRVLKVFEQLARIQPAGLSALARAMDADKSALQRDLATLAEAGWIQPSPGDSRAWELSHQLLLLARQPHSSRMLGDQLRPLLERLHKVTGETVYVAVPHHDRFVVIQAIESPHFLRIVPPVGLIVPLKGSATGKAFLSVLDQSERESAYGGPLSAALAAEMNAIRADGYAVSDGELIPGTIAFAAPIVDGTGRPAGTLVVTASSERVARSQWSKIGKHLADAAVLASRTLAAGSTEPLPEQL